MFSLRRPTEAVIRRRLAAQESLPFTYPEVGATRRGAPGGYPLNHHRARLGSGALTYGRAVEAVRRWAMYELSWTTLCWPDAPIRPGVAVGVLVRHLGFWSLNPCRIVYVLEENGAVERYGFAFGTLPGHAERGEERFTVEWHRGDDSVWYEIFTFAAAHHWLVRLAPPFLRAVQTRFGRESLRAMQAAVQPGAHEPAH